MGCDIHVFVEVKGPVNWWSGTGELLRLPAYYGKFGALARVREPEGDAPRGLPADVSNDVREAWKRDGGHTPSWCTVERWREVAGDDPLWLAVAAYAEAYAADPDTDEVRIVFWFDN